MCQIYVSRSGILALPLISPTLNLKCPCTQVWAAWNGIKIRVMGLPGCALGGDSVPPRANRVLEHRLQDHVGVCRRRIHFCVCDQEPLLTRIPRSAAIWKTWSRRAMHTMSPGIIHCELGAFRVQPVPRRNSSTRLQQHSVHAVPAGDVQRRTGARDLQALPWKHVDAGQRIRHGGSMPASMH